MPSRANSSEQVAATYEYDAYGKVLSSTGSIYNPFGYTGEYTDEESGLVYLRARYYDPGTQQLLTVDPILEITGDAYAYVTGSPTNLVDPSGLGYQWDMSTSMRYSIMDGVGMDMRPVMTIPAFATYGYQAGNPALRGRGFSSMRQINNRTLGRPRRLPDSPGYKDPPSSPRITALGFRRDTRVARDCFGYNVLDPDLPNIPWKENRAWLDEVIARGDEIYLASNVDYTKDYFLRSYFRKDIEHLQKRGYILDTSAPAHRIYRPR